VKKAGFFMSKHLLLRNSHFYYRQWIPLDLRSFFDGRADITTSLKTRDKREALTLLRGLQQKYQLTFTLLRSGILSKEHEQSIISTYTLVQEKPTKKKSTRLNDLYDLYHAEKSPNWTKRTPGEINAQFEGVVKVIGNLPADNLDRAVLIAGREKLLERLSVRTVNKYMTLLSSVLLWGVKHGYISNNPAEGLQLELKKRADEERKAYDLEDIRRVIEHIPSKDCYDPFKFWIPMIGMYSGMRREEICQVSASDIKDVNGIWCFDINDDTGKSTKTKSSVRLVPIHPMLIGAGLLDYVSAKINKEENLWGFRQWKGTWGKQFGNWWSIHFNRKYVTSDPLKTFHSFRHTVANQLKQKGVQESLIAEILGHSNANITTGRYGKRYQPNVLLEAMLKLDYGVTIPEWKW
jgi:integrase